MRVLTILLCLTATVAEAAVTIRGHLNISSVLAPDTAVLLDNGLVGKALVHRDGLFSLPTSAQGDHILSVADREFSFPSLSVYIQGDIIEVRPYTIGHAPQDRSAVPTLAHPVILQPSDRKEYFDSAKKFSILDLILQNKMILLMGAAAVFAMGMPKLLEMIDPEALKEVQANQAEMHRNMANIQNIDVAGGLSKMLAGNNKDTTNVASARRRKAA